MYTNIRYSPLFPCPSTIHWILHSLNHTHLWGLVAPVFQLSQQGQIDRMQQPLQCEHDIQIMDLALQYTDFPMTLKILSTCRICLQVILLSDIITANGLQVLPGIAQGQAPTTSQPTTLFPYQPNPNSASW